MGWGGGGGGGLERWRIVHEVRGLVDVNVSSWGEGKVG